MEAVAHGGTPPSSLCTNLLHGVPAEYVTRRGRNPFLQAGPLIPAHRLAAKHLHSFIQIGLYLKYDGNDTVNYWRCPSPGYPPRRSSGRSPTHSVTISHQVDGRHVNGFVVMLPKCYYVRFPGKRSGRPNPSIIPDSKESRSLRERRYSS